MGSIFDDLTPSIDTTLDFLDKITRPRAQFLVNDHAAGCYQLNEMFKDSDECCACMTNPCSVIFLPCLHLCVCQECLVKLEDKCPMCRKKIIEFIRWRPGSEGSESSKQRH